MSINVDPSTWRLLVTGTPDDPRNLPYKLLEGYPRGSFERENAKAEEQYIIRASDLSAFVNISFPLMTTYDEMLAWQSSRAFPSNASLRTKTVSFEPFEEGKPTDPYGVDDKAPDGTYAQFLRLTITYETGKPKDPDENDPTTFLEVSADATGEFLMLPMRGDATWGSPGENNPVSGVSTPVAQVIPEIAWGVRWPYIPNSFISTLLPVMRSCLGHLNSVVMPVLYDAAVETILFVGFSLREQYTWRNGEIGKPPVEVEFKFLEKHIEIEGEIIGHNHFWREETGTFEVLELPGGGWVYRATDLNKMFAPEVGEE